MDEETFWKKCLGKIQNLTKFIHVAPTNNTGNGDTVGAEISMPIISTDNVKPVGESSLTPSNQEIHLEEENNKELWEVINSDMSTIPPLEHTVKKDSDVDFSANYRKLIQECADLIKQYDALVDRVESEEQRNLLADISEKLINAMIRCGGTPIMGDKFFDVIRHKRIPVTIVENGTPIVNTLRSGVIIGNRVYVPALVEI